MKWTQLQKPSPTEVQLSRNALFFSKKRSCSSFSPGGKGRRSYGTNGCTADRSPPTRGRCAESECKNEARCQRRYQFPPILEFECLMLRVCEIFVYGQPIAAKQAELCSLSTLCDPSPFGTSSSVPTHAATLKNRVRAFEAH